MKKKKTLKERGDEKGSGEKTGNRVGLEAFRTFKPMIHPVSFLSFSSTFGARDGIRRHLFWK